MKLDNWRNRTTAAVCGLSKLKWIVRSTTFAEFRLKPDTARLKIQARSASEWFWRLGNYSLKLRACITCNPLSKYWAKTLKAGTSNWSTQFGWTSSAVGVCAAGDLRILLAPTTTGRSSVSFRLEFMMVSGSSLYSSTPLRGVKIRLGESIYLTASPILSSLS